MNQHPPQSVVRHPARPTFVWRVVLSVLLLVHLVAMVIGPLATPPSTRLSGRVFDQFTYYIEPLYLNHGYHFFAPEPAASHLVRFEVEKADGSQVTGTFPDREEHWPRLLYHRHFMLTDMALPSGPPDPRQLETPDWTKWPNSPWQETLARSFARHLLHEYNGKRVKLTYIQHQLTSPMEMLAHLNPGDQQYLPPPEFRGPAPQPWDGPFLTRPETYMERPLGTFTRDQLLPEDGAS